MRVLRTTYRLGTTRIVRAKEPNTLARTHHSEFWGQLHSLTDQVRPRPNTN